LKKIDEHTEAKCTELHYGKNADHVQTTTTFMWYVGNRGSSRCILDFKYRI